MHFKNPFSAPIFQNRELVASAIVFHFLMLSLGMCKIAVPHRWIYGAQYAYARITGAGGSFGFFSPNVPRELDVLFDVETADHQILQTSLIDSVPPEVRARLGNMIRLLEKNYREEQVTRSVAASLAASVFRKYPNALTVTLHAYIYYFPKMQEYRNGRRPELRQIYSATFRKGS